MSRRAWLTSDTIPTADFICRRLVIPNDVRFIANVSGALLSLCEAWNWEQFGSATIEDTVKAMTTMLNGYFEGTACMIGAILPYATSSVPSGTLPCDGSTFNRVDYPSLYNALDSAYIIDGNTFKTPDLRGRSIIGTGQGLNLTERLVGDIGGEETHDLSVGEMPEHSHTTQPHSHTTQPHSHTDLGHGHLSAYPVFNIDLEGVGVPDVLGAGNPPVQVPTTTGFANIQASTVTVDNSTVTVDNAGSGDSHENMSPFHVLRYCIVAR